ncbi:DUF6096 family protein [Sporosarcina sp. FA9]|uniref:DUF6096 family protein n=1 Tax=Sporosarcina sp. FA9 TaxID=3413030 RepID=UPI003F65DAE5
MRYTTFTVGTKDFKMRITASGIIELEKKLGGRNPLSILMAIEGGDLPSVSSVLLILHAAMQKFHHGTKFDDVLSLYDEYTEDGNSYIDLMPVLMDVFKVSGFFNGAAQGAKTPASQ